MSPSWRGVGVGSEVRSCEAGIDGTDTRSSMERTRDERHESKTGGGGVTWLGEKHLGTSRLQTILGGLLQAGFTVLETGAGVSVEKPHCQIIFYVHFTSILRPMKTPPGPFQKTSASSHGDVKL